jgi:hypothetical protein
MGKKGKGLKGKSANRQVRSKTSQAKRRVPTAAVKKFSLKALKSKSSTSTSQTSDAPLPTGPDTLVGVLRCLEGYLESASKEEQASVLQKLNSETGLNLLTDYSGTGQPEHVVHRLAQWASDRGVEVLVRCLRATDFSLVCQKLLTNYHADPLNPDQPATKTCVMTDSTLVQIRSVHLYFRNGESPAPLNQTMKTHI